MPKYHESIAGLSGRTIALGNLELYYEEAGTGAPLLLLHGFGGCTLNWTPFVADLAREYRVLLVDLRGHGRSTNPDNHFTHQDAAADIRALLDALGIDRCAAMGMSTGGMTLLHLAAQQPGRLRALVLISATTHFPEPARAIMRRARLETLPPDVRTMYQTCAQRGDAQIRQLLAQFNAFADNHTDMNFTAEALSAIRARTLIVHGDRDAFFPVEIALDLYRGIPEAELWIVPGGAHVPVYDEAVPFTATALRFLRH